MIQSAISNTVDTRLVATTSIVAKLAVGAILIAGITDARAVETVHSKAIHAKVVHAKAVHAKAFHAKAVSSKTVHSKDIAKLEREWKRQHASGERIMLHRLVACRELGQCDGLKVHPTLGSALISVSPERPGLGAAVMQPARSTVTAARDAYAKGKKPVVSARLKNKPASPVRIRAAAIHTDVAEPESTWPQVQEDHRQWVFGTLPAIP